LLSTITPITSTQAPQTQSSISSFSNPWESTHTTKTKSAGITTDPWSSTDGKNNGESPSLNTFSSFPIKTTLVSTSHGSGFSSFTGVSSDNRTLPETERTWNDESTEKKFDDDGFGLFETADVWK
jgi:hypothetical protein